MKNSQTSRLATTIVFVISLTLIGCGGPEGKANGSACASNADCASGQCSLLQTGGQICADAVGGNNGGLFGTNTNNTNNNNETFGPTPPQTPGSFGAPCERNDQCTSNACVGVEGQAYYCSQQCNGTCPSGFTCVQASQDLAICARNEDVGEKKEQQVPSQTSCSSSEVNGWIGCANQCAQNDQACFSQCNQMLGQSCLGCLQTLAQCAQSQNCDPFAGGNCCASERMMCIGQ